MLSIAVACLTLGVDIGLARLGYGLLLPAIRTDVGGSYAVYGAIGAVNLAGYLAGTILAARFITKRVHLPRVVAVAQLAVAAGLVGSAFAHAPVVLGAARAALGIASGIAIVAAVTDALERVAAARRGLTSSIAFAGIGVGVLLSAPAGQWAISAAVRWRGVTLAFAAAAVAVALAALSLRAHVIPELPSPTAEHPFRWRDLATARYLWFVGAYTCFGIAYISYATFAVAAFATRGIVGGTLTAVWFGYGLSAVVGALATSRVLAGPWQRYALAVPLTAGAAGCVLSLVNGTLAAIVGAIFVGASLAATPGVASAFARARSDRATAARAFAAVTACFGVGQMIGPLISGALVDEFGLQAATLIGAVVFALGSALAYIDAGQQAQRADVSA